MYGVLYCTVLFCTALNLCLRWQEMLIKNTENFFKTHIENRKIYPPLLLNVHPCAKPNFFLVAFASAITLFFHICQNTENWLCFLPFDERFFILLMFSFFLPSVRDLKKCVKTVKTNRIHTVHVFSNIDVSIIYKSW